MYNLSDIHGRKVLTGIDTDGNHWSQFEVDYIGMESKEFDTCTECGLELEYGWVNKDNPSIKVCDDEVQYESKRSYYFPEEEHLAFTIPTPSPNVHPSINPSTKYWLL